jgi:hypothetical protein
LGIIVFRTLVEGYKAYRIWNFLAHRYFATESIRSTFKSSVILILVVGIMNEIVLIGIIVSTIKCTLNFGKGLKEILIKQSLAKDSLPMNDLTNSNI